MDIVTAKTRFGDLLTASEARNRLYFLLTLFEGWGLKSTSSFGVEVNRFTQYALLDRTKAGVAAGIPPQEALLLLQWNLENKAFYAVLRNVVSLLTGRRLSPIPWDRKLEEYRAGASSVSISTTKILKNLVGDLRSAGFADLGDELQATHIDRVAPVRHACAHAAFLCPNEQGRDHWVFGDYVPNGSGGMRAEETTMTVAEFGDLCTSFFNFRFGFLAAVADRRESMRPIELRFSAENQCKPGEMLDCHFKDGNLAIKLKGTSLW